MIIFITVSKQPIQVFNIPKKLIKQLLKLKVHKIQLLTSFNRKQIASIYQSLP